jgi:hypothetical protein
LGFGIRLLLDKGLERFQAFPIYISVVQVKKKCGVSGEPEKNYSLCYFECAL